MNNFEKDYQDFLSAEKEAPSEKISNDILNYVKSDLNPTHKVVFLKLLSIQAFIGSLTLLFCPQFSLSLTNNHKLFHYFHYNFGEDICMFVCGSIFIGSGAIFAAHLMKRSEIKKIQTSKILYYFSISSIFLATFIFIGSETYLRLLAFWFIGASTSGIVLFELNRLIRDRVAAASV